MRLLNAAALGYSFAAGTSDGPGAENTVFEILSFMAGFMTSLIDAEGNTVPDDDSAMGNSPRYGEPDRRGRSHSHEQMNFYGNYSYPKDYSEAFKKAHIVGERSVPGATEVV
ncbi:ERAD-associated protein [Ciborinia camelliae]|nr:ERAD-associated protein [Ciborinia camelliae]